MDRDIVIILTLVELSCKFLFMSDIFKYPEKFDVIVIGAGHAGCEAALACSRMGVKTLLITIGLDNIAQMSCNPAIGGIAKGHLVREIDALGGEMGKNIDKTGIQFRILNTKKGPAVQAPRAQADKKAYQFTMKHVLEQQKNLILKQDIAEEIVIKNKKVSSVITKRKVQYSAGAVIITTGTFLRGLIHIGQYQYKAGRAEEFSAEKLSASLKNLGLKLGRLKTGTPARVNRKSINFSKLQEQRGDCVPVPFSFSTEKINRPQISCYISYTNKRTHDIIRANLKKSPLYGPKRLIKGIGPRYCPSIEDKVVKFPHHEKHQIFLEPEGYDTEEIYVNGFSSSLPEEVQYQMYHTIPGLKKVEILRPAYAIEYDFVFPYQLKPNLETKKIKNLFLAGQINGTSGYEEAAGQGLIAGINAVLAVKKKKPFIISRAESYIGVMIDDLITKGIDEPYRLFTSRAEYRLLLRCDNADSRLMKYGYQFGLVNKTTYEKMIAKYKWLDNKIKLYKNQPVISRTFNKTSLAKKRHIKLRQGQKLYQILKRPEIGMQDFELLDKSLSNIKYYDKVALYTAIKYEGYIKRELNDLLKFKKMENHLIPEDFNYDKIVGLSLESRQRLKDIKPVSLGQASRIMGIRPSDISLLIIYLKKFETMRGKS